MEFDSIPGLQSTSYHFEVNLFNHPVPIPEEKEKFIEKEKLRKQQFLRELSEHILSSPERITERWALKTPTHVHEFPFFLDNLLTYIRVDAWRYKISLSHSELFSLINQQIVKPALCAVISSSIAFNRFYDDYEEHLDYFNIAPCHDLFTFTQSLASYILKYINVNREWIIAQLQTSQQVFFTFVTCALQENEETFNSFYKNCITFLQVENKDFIERRVSDEHILKYLSWTLEHRYSLTPRQKAIYEGRLLLLVKESPFLGKKYSSFYEISSDRFFNAAPQLINTESNPHVPSLSLSQLPK